MLERAGAMMSVLADKGLDLTAFRSFQDDLVGLMSAGVTDTVSSLTGTGGSTVWYELLTSGMYLAHEHFSEEYLAWMLSTDDSELLFSAGDDFDRVIVAGEDIQILVDADLDEDGGFRVYDSTEADDRVAVVRMGQTYYISLPDGYDYTVTVRGTKPETQVRVGADHVELSNVGDPTSTTNILTLYEGEELVMTVPDDETLQATVALNGTSQVPLYRGEAGGAFRDLFAGTSKSEYGQMMTNAVAASVMIPYLASGALLLLYALVVGIKRLVRHRIDDSCSYRKVGRVILWIAAAMSASLCIPGLLTLVDTAGRYASVHLNDRTLQRVSEYLGWGEKGYQASSLVIYGLMTGLSIHSARHQLSRIRLFRLSLLVVLLNTFTLFTAADIETLSLSGELTFLVPLTALLGLLLVRSRSGDEREVGRHWLPVSRTIVATLILFALRQVLVGLTDAPELTALVVMKALAGLPVTILAAWLWRKHRAPMQQMTFFAMLCYMVANTAINLHMGLGMLCYAVGHVLLAAGCCRTKKPSASHLLAGCALAAVLLVLVFRERSLLP